MNSKELKELEEATFYHDLGKLILEKEILEKRASLSEMDIKMIQRHPEK